MSNLPMQITNQESNVPVAHPVGRSLNLECNEELDKSFDVEDTMVFDNLSTAVFDTITSAFFDICQARGQANLGNDFAIDITSFHLGDRLRSGELNINIDVKLSPDYFPRPQSIPYLLQMYSSALREKFIEYRRMWELLDTKQDRYIDCVYKIVQFDEHHFRVITTYGCIWFPSEIRKMCPIYTSKPNGVMKELDWNDYNVYMDYGYDTSVAK